MILLGTNNNDWTSSSMAFLTISLDDLDMNTCETLQSMSLHFDFSRNNVNRFVSPSYCEFVALGRFAVTYWQWWIVPLNKSHAPQIANKGVEVVPCSLWSSRSELCNAKASAGFAGVQTSFAVAGAVTGAGDFVVVVVASVVVAVASGAVAFVWH